MLESIVPPNSPEIEKAVIGAILLNSELIHEAEGLTPEDFYKKDHADIFRTFRELSESGDPIDVFTVSNRLNGLKAYLMQLA